MRRKARLKVLYWPILASVCIILILAGLGSVGPKLNPKVTQIWAGGDLGTKLEGWLPRGASPRTVTLPWHDLASRQSLSREVAPPRTLVVQSEGLGLIGARQTIDARQDLDDSGQPRGFHSPHALRTQAAAELSRVAEA
ncbi:MAG: hypothetical protein ACO1RT_17900, partial [Planctomycetaceae bacterium]